MNWLFAGISVAGPFFSVFVIAWCTAVPVCIVIPALFASNTVAKWSFQALACFLSGEVLLHFLCASCTSLRLGKRSGFVLNAARDHATSPNASSAIMTNAANVPLPPRHPNDDADGGESDALISATARHASVDVAEALSDRERWWREMSAPTGDVSVSPWYPGRTGEGGAEKRKEAEAYEGMSNEKVEEEEEEGSFYPVPSSVLEHSSTPTVVMVANRKNRALIRLHEEEEEEMRRLIMDRGKEDDRESGEETQRESCESHTLIQWIKMHSSLCHTYGRLSAQLCRVCTLAASFAFRRRGPVFLGSFYYRRPTPEVDPSVLQDIHAYIAFTDTLSPEERRRTVLDAPRRFCDVCHRYKAPREHHCSVCNACVPKMDHHCVWIDNCVDVANERFFLSMIIWVLLSCSVEVALLGYGYVAYRSAEQEAQRQEVDVLPSAADRVPLNRFGPAGAMLCSREVVHVLLAASFLVLAMLLFLYFHLPGLLTNTTSIEREVMEGKRRLFASSSFLYRNPYDLRHQQGPLVVNDDPSQDCCAEAAKERPNDTAAGRSGGLGDVGWLRNILEVYGRPHWFSEDFSREDNDQTPRETSRENDANDEYSCPAPPSHSRTRWLAMKVAQRCLPSSVLVTKAPRRARLVTQDCRPPFQSRDWTRERGDQQHIVELLEVVEETHGRGGRGVELARESLRSLNRPAENSSVLSRLAQRVRWGCWVRLLEPMRSICGISAMLLFLLMIPIFDGDNAIYDGIYYPSVSQTRQGIVSHERREA